jgi:two-component system response regulator EvgA
MPRFTPRAKQAKFTSTNRKKIEKRMSTVLVVDDHPTTRMAVKILLEREGHKVIAETDNGIEAIRLARDMVPDIAIIDIGIPELDGLDVVSRLKSLGIKTKVLILTAQPVTHFGNRSAKAGAAGYVSKNGNMDELINAVKAILSGYHYFPQEAVTTTFRTEQELISRLTDREIMVLKYIVKGIRIKDIAASMLLSDKTISTYKARIMGKLEVSTIVELIDTARKNGIF